MASRLFVSNLLARHVHVNHCQRFGLLCGSINQNLVSRKSRLLHQSNILYSKPMKIGSESKQTQMPAMIVILDDLSTQFSRGLLYPLKIRLKPFPASSRTTQNCCAYGTWTLSGFSRPSSSHLQPYLEIEEVIANIPKHQEVMKLRKMVKQPDLTQLADLYQKVKDLKIEMENITKFKDENAAKVQEMLKASSEKKFTAEIHALREKGRDLRDEARKISSNYQEASDTLIGLVLSIPNQLDQATPLHDYQLLRDFLAKDGIEGFKIPDDFRSEVLTQVGPNAEYSVGPAAMLELEVASTCQKFLLAEGFTETGNVDFVKRILLDGIGLDPKQFLKIREIASKTGKHHATYLVGGATFPAFLALFAQSIIQQKEVLPIQYFVIGRAYTKSKDKDNNPVQDTIIQVFVACKDQEQEEEQFSRVKNMMERFYSEVIGVSAEVRLLPAPQLKTFEKKRVSFVKDGGTKVIGDLITTGDYISKRLLCCYNDRRIPKFLHLVTGQFFNITDFIRPVLLRSLKSENQRTSEDIKTEAETISLATKILPPAPDKTDDLTDPTKKT